jgi:hypothetical protein
MRHLPMLLATLAVGSVLVLRGAASANDSAAELGAGGVVLTRSDSIVMESEDLYVSQDRVPDTRKSSPTTFEVVGEKFVPEQDLRILFVPAR